MKLEMLLPMLVRQQKRLAELRYIQCSLRKRQRPQPKERIRPPLMRRMLRTMSLNAIGTAIQAADRANEAAEAADAVRNELALALHIPITHASLLALRNAGELTKGAFYRITDYECTTTQADTRSANHPFDIFCTGSR